VLVVVERITFLFAAAALAFGPVTNTLKTTIEKKPTALLIINLHNRRVIISALPDVYLSREQKLENQSDGCPSKYKPGGVDLETEDKRG
jgi:hypothetical protein